MTTPIYDLYRARLDAALRDERPPEPTPEQRARVKALADDLREKFGLVRPKGRKA